MNALHAAIMDWGLAVAAAVVVMITSCTFASQQASLTTPEAQRRIQMQAPHRPATRTAVKGISAGAPAMRAADLLGYLDVDSPRQRAPPAPGPDGSIPRDR